MRAHCQHWWSILQLAGASALLLLNGLADQTRRWRYYWFFLAVVFIFLSLDEAAEIHETMFAETLAPYAVNQFLRFTWIIPYAFAALLVAAIYVPFLHALPAKTRWGMVVAGALYVAAAVGAEALGAYCSAGGSSLCLKFSVIFEESGEIIAIALFLLVLLKLLQLRCPMIAARL